MITPEEFRKRFALAVFSDGGIIVDAVGGGYSLLNASAAALLIEIERSESWDEATAASAIRLGISREVAARESDELIRQAGGLGISQPAIGPFRYQPSPDGGYDLLDSQGPVLHSDDRGQQLSLLVAPESLAFRIYDYVSEMAPKLMFLQGTIVIHGSGCHRAGTATGMSGASRAGKTTTAKALAANGLSLVSEDLLIFDPDLTKPRLCIDGERTVNAWTMAASSALEKHPEESVDASRLVEAAIGPTVALKAIWFLDVRRRGEKFRLNRLTKADALSLLMGNAFLGAADSHNWRRYLASARSIVAAVDSYAADMPDGLAALEAAMLTYTTNSAS